MFRNGVIMDITNVEQPQATEAMDIIVLDKLPYGVERVGGVMRWLMP